MFKKHAILAAVLAVIIMSAFALIFAKETALLESFYHLIENNDSAKRY